MRIAARLVCSTSLKSIARADIRAALGRSVAQMKLASGSITRSRSLSAACSVHD